jgi:hypothetical protein
LAQISHIVEYDSVKCYRLTALISAVGLIYLDFFHESTSVTSKSAPATTQNVLDFNLNDFLLTFILVEFLFFSITLINRIAGLLGIHVFRSGRLPGSPLDIKDGGTDLEIRG